MYFASAVILAVSSAALARPIHLRPRAALDTGSCGSPEIQFADGLDGRNEASFQAVNQADFNHGSALNIGVIANFICGQLQSKCKASADTVAACDQGTQDAAQATAGAAADAFNAALGITSNFAAGTGNSAAGAVAVADADSTANNAAAGADPTAPAEAEADSAAGAGAADAAALDTGSCGSPEIQFADGLDGRNEASFQAVNQADFNHGSALNIGVIADFVCGQLQSKCKASADTVAACDQGTQDAAQATGGAAADAFNAALGITSNFAAGAASASDAAAPAAAEASNGAAAGAGGGDAVAAAAPAAVAAGNLQTFTGTLGATPPAVTSSGDGQFQVDGNASFKDLQNALVRDVQHNQCANAANASGNQGALSVAACGTQQDQCNAAAKSA